MTDGTTTERALRVALKEAADQIDVHPLLALEPADRPGESPKRPRRAMVLVAVAVLVTSALIGVFVVRDDDGTSVRPAMPATRQVPSDAIPLASADLVVYMAVDATDVQIAVVRDLLDASPEVATFALETRDDAYREFSRIFSCKPDLVDSITPEHLPRAFRLVAADPGLLTDLRAVLTTQNGVNSIVTGTQAAEQGSGACAPPGA
jgi:hypothetical protein